MQEIDTPQVESPPERDMGRGERRGNQGKLPRRRGLRREGRAGSPRASSTLSSLNFFLQIQRSQGGLTSPRWTDQIGVGRDGCARGQPGGGWHRGGGPAMCWRVLGGRRGPGRVLRYPAQTSPRSHGSFSMTEGDSRDGQPSPGSARAAGSEPRPPAPTAHTFPPKQVCWMEAPGWGSVGGSREWIPELYKRQTNEMGLSEKWGAGEKEG